MANRLDLHTELENILGSEYVYYQPPESIKLVYPCIVYSRSDIDNEHANNDVYLQNHAYQITVIDRNPDSEIVYNVSKMRSCRFDRHFTTSGLNHDVFTIYY